VAEVKAAEKRPEECLPILTGSIGPSFYGILFQNITARLPSPRSRVPFSAARNIRVKARLKNLKKTKNNKTIETTRWTTIR